MKSTYILMIVLLAAPLTADATVIAYADDDTLFSKADIVVDAKVWRWDLRNSNYEATDYELEALECFKGCKKGEFFTMSSLGVSSTREQVGSHETIAGAPHPETGDRVIVYLSKHPDGSNHILGLGLGFFKLHYNNELKRFIAHRETETLFLLRPSNRVARDASNQVLVPTDSFASDVIEKLRNKAKGR